jgi:hypothetical protein
VTRPDDQNLLEGLRDLFSVLDPMPPDLVLHSQFAVDLDQLDLAVAVPAHEARLAGVRSRARTRLVSFDAPAMTVTVELRLRDDGTTRVDGWLTPPQDRTVELRTEHGSTTARALRGRFVFDAVVPGLAQIQVHDTDGGAVVTPAIVL